MSTCSECPTDSAAGLRRVVLWTVLVVIFALPSAAGLATAFQS